tara:strand:+ start:973 stop:1194 length:222 start_codon:yes stop_codon:yes gene_type:complete
MISYVFDHEYAGDLASLGIEYQSSNDNDYEIVVTEFDDHKLTDYLKEHCSHYYVVAKATYIMDNPHIYPEYFN